MSMFKRREKRMDDSDSSLFSTEYVMLHNGKSFSFSSLQSMDKYIRENAIDTLSIDSNTYFYCVKTYSIKRNNINTNINIDN